LCRANELTAKVAQHRRLVAVDQIDLSDVNQIEIQATSSRSARFWLRKVCTLEHDDIDVERYAGARQHRMKKGASYKKHAFSK
jgi:hypothetical protein